MCNNDKYSIVYIFWVSIIQNHFNTAHQSYMFKAIYNSIPKITNTSIIKPIIFIYILKKYLDIPIYLDNHTPLLIVQFHARDKECCGN